MNKFPFFNLFATIVLIMNLIIDIPLAIKQDSLVIFVYGLIDGSLFVLVMMSWIIYFVKK